MRHRLILPLVALMLSPRSAPAQQGLLEAVMQGLAAVPQSRADFTEQRHFAALTTVLDSTGHLLWQRPDYLEKTTVAPRPETLIVRGDELRLTEANQAERLVSLASQPAIGALVEAIRGPLSGDLPTLRRHYAVTAAGTPAAWQIRLVPTDPQVAALLKQVTLAGMPGEIRSIRIEQADGDTQDMTITPVR